MTIEFHNTGYGRRFFEVQLPELTKRLADLAHEFKRYNDAGEAVDLKEAPKSPLDASLPDFTAPIKAEEVAEALRRERESGRLISEEPEEMSKKVLDWLAKYYFSAGKMDHFMILNTVYMFGVASTAEAAERLDVSASRISRIKSEIADDYRARARELSPRRKVWERPKEVEARGLAERLARHALEAYGINTNAEEEGLQARRDKSRESIFRVLSEEGLVASE